MSAPDRTTTLPGLDLDRFRDHYDRRRPGELQGRLQASLITGGKSNLTYRVWDDGNRWVVRRPPVGRVLATAHDVQREYTVMQALAGSEVPVPPVHLLCREPDVLGAPFYVMGEVGGHTYRSASELDRLGPARTATIAGRLVDTLAALHVIDPVQVGLESFGRPEGFLGRQVRRWAVQLARATRREIPGAAELASGLASAIPATGDVAILHGDYRLDNLLVEDDRITAVLDWEMATLGDPLTDLALMVVYQDLATVPGASIVTTASNARGYPGPGQIVARYAAATGRDVSAFGWYLGLAYFKLAVILEGIEARRRKGQTVGEGFDGVGVLVEPLITRGLERLREHTS